MADAVRMPTDDEPVTVVQGDCLDVLRELPDGCVDAVVTDPPYGISYQSAWRTDKSQWKPKIANDDAPFVWWLHDAARALKMGGALICFCRWDVQEAFRLAIGWTGLKVRAQIIWDRVGHGAGDPAVSPAPCHDVIWYATKGRRVFHGTRPTSMVRASRLQGNALQHPNEKPLALMTSLVGSYVAPGDLVVDPFAGSGTTGASVFTVGEGRKCILIEKEPAYADICRKRVAEAMGRGNGSLLNHVA